MQVKQYSIKTGVHITFPTALEALCRSTWEHGISQRCCWVGKSAALQFQLVQRYQIQALKTSLFYHTDPSKLKSAGCDKWEITAF